MFSLLKKKQPPPWISAVVVAAGSASRMNGIDKQLLLLEDIPVVVHSIHQLEQCPRITEIVVVCREDQIADYYRLVQEYALEKVSYVVKGGSQRQDSVFQGIAACAEHADLFVIHDGARPLVTPQEIEACIDAATAHGAAALGWPVKDTIKVCSPDGAILSTPERKTLFAVATPQIFAAKLYREAMQRAQKENASYTDDCQLIEHCGHPVYVVPGNSENLKITTPEDAVVAQAILAYREEGILQ